LCLSSIIQVDYAGVICTWGSLFRVDDQRKPL
jgi:hypothetical protein